MGKLCRTCLVWSTSRGIWRRAPSDLFNNEIIHILLIFRIWGIPHIKNQHIQEMLHISFLILSIFKELIYMHVERDALTHVGKIRRERLKSAIFLLNNIGRRRDDSWKRRNMDIYRSHWGLMWNSGQDREFPYLGSEKTTSDRKKYGRN